MRIIWHSAAPWAGTGYGQQTAIWTRKLRDLGHEVAISSLFGLDGARLGWEGMVVYPGDPMHRDFGKIHLPMWALHHGEGDATRCLVITLMDVHNLTTPALAALRIASWVPVDHEPAPPRVLEFFRQTRAQPIAMSRFGERMLREEGLEPLYVPHGIDTTVFAPQPDRAEIRSAYGIPESAFVVGMVAANIGTNPPRKAWPQVFEAFAALRAKHSDALLYLHTDVTGRQEGLNLAALAERCGIPDDAWTYTDPVQYALGIDPEVVSRAVYSLFDVLANPSYGEGFGLPIVEAQACGVPVVVSDHSAMPELLGAGWKVRGMRMYDPGQGAWYWMPSVADIAGAFFEAYDRAEGLREQAREFALGYDVERVLEDYWKPVLEKLEAPREVAPLPGANRAHRRALAKANR